MAKKDDDIYEQIQGEKKYPPKQRDIAGRAMRGVKRHSQRRRKRGQYRE